MRLAGVLLVLGLLPVGLAAQESAAPAASVDTGAAQQDTKLAEQDAKLAQEDARPTRAARLTFVAGAVRVERVDNTAEDTPVVNMPLVEGTRLVTGDYGQAEIEFEDGSVARLTPRSALSLDVLAIADGTAKTQMTLLSGLAYFELRKAAGYSYRVDGGGIQMTPTANATVRFNLDDPGAVVSVLVGEVRVEHVDGFRAGVREGESLRTDPKDETRYFLNAQIADESWDRWNESRDATAADEADRRTEARDGFAGEQGYGWSDLDANGSWYDTPNDGRLWQPAAADEEFDPYGYGSWVWGNTGYVYVSGYSWGWTPYRCGRWLYSNGFGWGWQPGRSCGVFGYAGSEGGWGGVRVWRGPPRYQRPVRPGPKPVHPIVVVHGRDGLRPPLRVGGPIIIGRTHIEPLKPIGRGDERGGRGGPVLGVALERDFPVDRKTGKPVVGRVAVADEPAFGSRPGWRTVEPRGAVRAEGAPPPAKGGTVPAGSVPVGTISGYVPGSTPTNSLPERRVRPVVAAPVPITTTAPPPARTPIFAPPPNRPAPAPVQQAPVRIAPPPQVPVQTAPAPSPPASIAPATPARTLPK